MIYGYIRVSTDRQTVENQRFEIKKFAEKRQIQISEWIEETISGLKNKKEGEFGKLLKRLKSEDVVIISEVSRMGRDLLEIMSVLHDCMERNVVILTVKEKYELGDNINSKVLAFAFGLSAEIERKLISQRTKEALARKKAEGVILGRPIGKKSKTVKLTGKGDLIKSYLEKKISQSAIARMLGVHRSTIALFLANEKN